MHRHLLAAAALATLLSVSAASNFAFYKFSLRWPTSICNTGADCKSPIPSIFTIHGLWPQLASDHEVPPYDIDKNKCNDNPTSPDDILVKLQPIKTDLEQMWPSIRHNEDDATFWKLEWKRHGMCSEYPKNPYAYFDAALTLAKQYNPFEVMGIEPADKTLYQVKEILENVKKNVKAYPQISCNMLAKVGTLQLREIRFCFEKGNPPTKLIDCPNKVGDKCTSETDEIRFPPPPPMGISSRTNITWEFVSS